MRIRRSLLVVGLGLALGGCASSRGPLPPSSPRGDDVEQSLDDLNRAASSGDVDRYLAHFTRDARVVDAATSVPVELDDLGAASRKGLTRVSTRAPTVPKHRVTMAASGRIAWFEEATAGDATGPRCVAGLMVKDDLAGWRVARCEATNVAIERNAPPKSIVAAKPAGGESDSSSTPREPATLRAARHDTKPGAVKRAHHGGVLLVPAVQRANQPFVLEQARAVARQ